MSKEKEKKLTKYNKYQPWMDSQEQVSAPPKPKKTIKSKKEKV